MLLGRRRRQGSPSHWSASRRLSAAPTAYHPRHVASIHRNPSHTAQSQARGSSSGDTTRAGCLLYCLYVKPIRRWKPGHRTQRKTKRGKEGRRGGGAMQVCVPLKRLPSGTIAKSIAPLHATSLALLAAAAGECPFVPAPYYIRSLKVPS